MHYFKARCTLIIHVRASTLSRVKRALLKILVFFCIQLNGSILLNFSLYPQSNNVIPAIVR